MIKVLLLLGMVLAWTGAEECQVRTRLTARRPLVDDGAINSLVYTGHGLKTLPLRVRWDASLSNRTASTLVLHPNHPLLLNDVPSDWYDGREALTLERMLIYSRSQFHLWHVSPGATPQSPQVC